MTPHPLAGLTVIWWAPLIIAIIALGAAALGELRQWFRESRELDRVQKLAAADNAARTPVRRDDYGDPSLGGLIVPSPRMERLCCGRCRTGNGHLPCCCAVDCYAVVCLQWDAVEEVQR